MMSRATKGSPCTFPNDEMVGLIRLTLKNLDKTGIIGESLDVAELRRLSHERPPWRLPRAFPS